MPPEGGMVKSLQLVNANPRKPGLAKFHSKEVIPMYEIDLKIGGMMCGMCESHINDAVRKALPVKKVTSSHSKGQTVILSEEAISEDACRAVIEDTGYDVLGYQCRPYEKKGLFHFGK